MKANEPKLRWCVVSPKGYHRLYTLSTEKKSSIYSFVGNDLSYWQTLKQEGWKCEKVTIVINPQSA